jgi:hypothetical protein
MNSSPSSRPSGSPDDEDEGVGDGEPLRSDCVGDGDPLRGDRWASLLEELDIFALKRQDLQLSVE